MGITTSKAFWLLRGKGFVGRQQRDLTALNHQQPGGNGFHYDHHHDDAFNAGLHKGLRILRSHTRVRTAYVLTTAVCVMMVMLYCFMMYWLTRRPAAAAAAVAGQRLQGLAEEGEGEYRDEEEKVGREMGLVEGEGW